MLKKNYTIISVITESIVIESFFEFHDLDDFISELKIVIEGFKFDIETFCLDKNFKEKSDKKLIDHLKKQNNQLIINYNELLKIVI